MLFVLCEQPEFTTRFSSHYCVHVPGAAFLGCAYKLTEAEDRGKVLKVLLLCFVRIELAIFAVVGAVWETFGFLLIIVYVPFASFLGCAYRLAEAEDWSNALKRLGVSIYITHTHTHTHTHTYIYI